MSPTESVTLARYIGAHFPQQPQDEFTADALGELLAPYPFADCRAAVLAIADRGDHWCSPSDVKAEVKRIRGKRIAAHPPVIPPADVEDERAFLLDIRRRIGDGEQIDPDAYRGELKARDMRQLTSAVGRHIESDENEESRA